jgi:flagellar motor protein MotB
MSKKYWLMFLAVFTFAFAGCQQPIGGGNTAARPNIFGNPSNSFAGSWNGGWNRNWNTTPAGLNGSGGIFSRQAATPNQLKAQGEQAQEVARLNQQLRELQGRVGNFDSDNNGLHSQIASLKQDLQRSNNVNTQLRQQLGDMAANVQQLQNLKGQYEQELARTKTENQRFAALGGSNGNSSVPSGFASAPTIRRANNSLLAGLQNIRIDGAQTRMDGDVIRVELPSDRVFVPGTYQLQPQAAGTFSQLATTIRQNFPNQYVGIEAHEGSQAMPVGGTSLHQTTVAQALTVFNQFASNGLPQQQMFIVGMAANRPRYQGNNSQNRRIEIVVYPESYKR